MLSQGRQDNIMHFQIWSIPLRSLIPTSTNPASRTCAENHLLPCKELDGLCRLSQALLGQERGISDDQVKFAFHNTLWQTQGVVVVVKDKLFSITLKAFIILQQDNVVVWRLNGQQLGEEGGAGNTSNPNN